jgi:hypothetical protein
MIQASKSSSKAVKQPYSGSETAVKPVRSCRHVLGGGHLQQ